MKLDYSEYKTFNLKFRCLSSSLRKSYHDIVSSDIPYPIRMDLVETLSTLYVQACSLHSDFLQKSCVVSSSLFEVVEKETFIPLD